MAVGAAVGVHQEGAARWVTESDAAWVVKDNACPVYRVINRQMNCWRCFILMAVQAVYCGVVSVSYHRLDRSPDWGGRVDVTG